MRVAGIWFCAKIKLKSEIPAKRELHLLVVLIIVFDVIGTLVDLRGRVHRLDLNQRYYAL